MAALPEIEQWDTLVYQIQPTDKVEGGPQGVANKPAQQIANRTNWLKVEMEIHNHALRYYTKAETDAQVEELEVAQHSHYDRYVPKDLIRNQLLSQLDHLLREHSHDDRYYTRTEIEELLGSSISYVHNHNSLYYSISALLDKFAFGLIDSDHTHDSTYMTKARFDTLISKKSLLSHDHNSVYYTRDEIATIFNNLLSNAHNHDTLYFTVTELVSLVPVHNHDTQYYTKTQVDTVLNGRSLLEHTHTNLGYMTDEDAAYAVSDVAFEGHTHPDLYVSKTEVDQHFSDKADQYHTHFDRYTTEADINAAISNKSELHHDHFEQYSECTANAITSNFETDKSVPGTAFISKIMGTVSTYTPDVTYDFTV